MTRKSLPKCGAKTRKGTRCKLAAGHGTDHTGAGKCKRHGGASTGAPMGNGNAVVTGEYQQIYTSALTPGERNIYDQVEAKPLERIMEELKLTTVRIHRMLLRLRGIEKAVEDSEDGMLRTGRTYTGGFQAQGRVNFEVLEYATATDTILRIESALDRMQQLKTKQIRELSVTLKANPEDTGGLDALVKILDDSAKAIALSEATEHEKEDE